MNLNYSKDKPCLLNQMWNIMEDMNEKFPHLRFGWDGFVLLRLEWQN